MKRLLTTLLTSILFLTSNCQILNVSFDYSTYMLSDKRPFVETYLLIDGKSVNYVVNDINLESKIDITMIFKNGDDLAEFRHFTVSNPPLPDTTEIFPDFTDVQRIFIPQGIYNFELKIRDLNAPDSLKKTITRHEIITIDIPQKQTAISGIELLSSFSPTLEKTINRKNGYECIPFCSSTFNAENEYLRFYTEFYNIANEIGNLGTCNVYTFIRDALTLKTIQGHSSSQTINAMNLYQFLKEINIKKLPTGKYFLVVEIRDNNNNLCSSAAKYFERENTIITSKPYEYANKTLRNANTFSNIDTLTNIINNLKYIADDEELETIEKVVKSADLTTMQYFMFNFWTQRNQFNPDIAMADYVKRIEIAEQNNYSTNQKQILFRYGMPNSIIADNAKPYIVWHYYKIGNLSNIKFVFKTSDNNSLLHSNMPCETKDIDWQKKLFGNQKLTTEESTIFEGL